jgi:hypothetical protein
MIPADRTTPAPSDTPGAGEARKTPRSHHTRAFLKAMASADDLAGRAADLYQKVAKPLAALDGELAALRSHSTLGLLSEQDPTVRADLEQADGRLAGAQNTVRDLSARFLDLARLLSAVANDTEPMTARAATAGYERTTE